MERRIFNAIFVAIMTLCMLSGTAAFALDAAEVPADGSRTESEAVFSAVMAINSAVAFAGDTQHEITPPVLAFDRTYVDLYSVAPFLGIEVTWTPAYSQAAAHGRSVQFTHIASHSDLTTQSHRYFVLHDKVFVALRELTELLGYPVAYDRGAITVGAPRPDSVALYDEVQVVDVTDHVYISYPYGAEYVVNPYQTYSYESMLRDAARLQELYPELIRVSSIGQSVESRELLLIELGRGSKKIFVCGTHHAREYIATTYLMNAIDKYAYAYRTNAIWGAYYPRDILDKVTFCIVPMVNPDGVNLVQNGIYATGHAEELAAMKIYEGAKYGYAAWKANVRGVDVNWNYDKDWIAGRNKNPRGSTGFNGDYPGSEPETAAVSAYVDSLPFEGFLSFHTQGQIFYWAEDVSNPTCLNQLIGADTGFACELEEGTGAGGSFFDYVYRKYGKATITVELCPYIGNFPYPDSDFDTVWNPAKNILLIAGQVYANR